MSQNLRKILCVKETVLFCKIFEIMFHKMKSSKIDQWFKDMTGFLVILLAF